MSEPLKTMSASEFRAHFADLLAQLRDDDAITFGGGQLTVLRVKERSPVTGPRCFDVEFNETYTVTTR